MDVDLTGIDLKIKRARDHLARLKTELTRILDPTRYGFTFERDSETGKHVYRVHGLPVLNDEWSVIVGEILYNLRSALDHLAWQLVLADGKTPGRSTQFPIRQTPFHPTEKGLLVPTQLKPRIDSPEILKALESVQPYIGVTDGEPADFQMSPLWQLATLNNIDKHRLLLVLPCVFAYDQMWYGWDSAKPNPGIDINPRPLHEGDPVAWFDFHGEDPPLGFDPHPSLRVALYEPGVGRVTMHPVENVLTTYCDWVEEQIVEWVFRPVLRGERPLI